MQAWQLVERLEHMHQKEGASWKALACALDWKAEGSSAGLGVPCRLFRGILEDNFLRPAYLGLAQPEAFPGSRVKRLISQRRHCATYLSRRPLGSDVMIPHQMRVIRGLASERCDERTDLQMNGNFLPPQGRISLRSCGEGGGGKMVGR